MGNLTIQTSLNGGELSPQLWGHVDLARYQNSLKTCRNFIVQAYGGARNRAGTRYLATVKNSANRVRLIGFEFNDAQTYVLELGDYYVRFYQNGGQMVYPVGSLYGTPGAPVEVSTPWAYTDLPGLQYTQCADVMTLAHPSYPPQQLGRVANDHWTLTPLVTVNGPFQAINVDATQSLWPNGTTGAVTITSTSAIFTANRVGMIFYVEQRDAGQPWEVSKAVALGDIRRYNGKYYQAQNPGTTGTLAPTHTVDSASDGAVVWLYLHSGYGVALITAVAGDHLSCSATVLSRLPDGSVVQTGAHPTTTVTAISAAGDGNIACTAVAHGFTSTTIGTVTINYTNAGGAQVLTGPFTVTVIDANTLKINVTYASLATPTFVSGTIVVGSTYKWAFGAFGGDQGYPSCATYHQQRLVLANTPQQPQTVWMSQTGNFPGFGKNIPIQDDDSITFTVASNKVDAVKTMMPLQSLILFTAGGEWAVNGGANDAAITPSNLQVGVQGYRGASSLPPLGVGNTALFLQQMGQTVRDLTYDWASNTFTGNDITVMASHLVEGHTIQEWEYQQVPFTSVWSIRDDGVLLGLTYLREQQVAGWHRHDTDGLYESVACISEGNEDVLYLAVNRTVNGTTCRYVERMNTRIITDIREAFFVDAGLSYDGRDRTQVRAGQDFTGATVTLSGGTNWDNTDGSITATASMPIFAWPATSDLGDQLVFQDAAGIYYNATIISESSATVAQVVLNKSLPLAYQNLPRTDWWMARNTFSGLSHLEGKTVSILADGCVQAQQVVTGGTITINPPAYRVHVGLPIQADLETLDLNIAQVETILPKVKAIPAVRFMVNESRSIWVGRDFDSLVETKCRSNENYDTPVNTQTGITVTRVPTSWTTSGRVCLRQNDPLPITVLAVIPEVTVGGAAS